MKITVVTHDSVFGRYFATTLSELISIDRIIVERPRISWRRPLRRLLRVGVVNAAFQGWLNRRFRVEGDRYLPEKAIPAHESVESANGCEFGHDELVVGFGSSYIRAATLARLQFGMLNLHTGILPNYRGVKSEFWALARGDADAIGWTLHFMAPGLDEGDIVLQSRVEWQGESLGEIRGKLLVDAVPKVGVLLDQVRRTGALPRTRQNEGAYFSAPLLRDWVAWRRRSTTEPRG
jgi:hypothetical protein